MKSYPWVRYLKRSGKDLPYDSPIYLGSHSNGEYFHEQTTRERKLRDEILRAGDDRARKLGMDRREFMASAMGMVTALSVIQGCSDKESGSGGGSGGFPGEYGASATGGATGGTGGTNQGTGGANPGTGGANPGTGGGGGTIDEGRDPNQPGQYCFDVDSSVDPTMCDQAARQVLQVPNFIMDAQTHCFDDAPDAAWRSSPPPGFETSLAALVGSCNQADAVNCVGRDDYARLMFLESPTTMAVLSAWPYGGGDSDPNNNPFLASTRDWINEEVAGSHRVVNHASIVKWKGVGGMDMALNAHGVGGWKLYPAAQGNLFAMDDATGRSFIEHGIELGVKTFSIHKGLPISGFDTNFNRPRDIGVVAAEYPDVNFIIYHSAICAGQDSQGFTCTPREGAYVEGSTDGSDALITALKDNNIPPNSNVYAEMGGAYSQLMSNPTSAGQWVAKLVTHVGENNVVWGTDSILSGNSPTGQINSFMALQHPVLTPEVKKKIMGLNLARVYCVDVDAKRCEIDGGKLAAYKRELDGEFGDYRHILLGHHRPLGPTTRREFLRLTDWYTRMEMIG